MAAVVVTQASAAGRDAPADGVAAPQMATAARPTRGASAVGCLPQLRFPGLRWMIGRAARLEKNILDEDQEEQAAVVGAPAPR